MAPLRITLIDDPDGEAISHHFALTVGLFRPRRWRLRLNGGGVYRHRL